MDAHLSSARERVPIPDTGSLRGDLQVLAASLAEATMTTQGRNWLYKLLPASQDAYLTEVRSDIWHRRFNDLAPIFQHAAERGELREGIDPVEAIQMFSAAYLFDVLFTDTPVRPGYAARVLDIFVHGITR